MLLLFCALDCGRSQCRDVFWDVIVMKRCQCSIYLLLLRTYMSMSCNHSLHNYYTVIQMLRKLFKKLKASYQTTRLHIVIVLVTWWHLAVTFCLSWGRQKTERSSQKPCHLFFKGFCREQVELKNWEELDNWGPFKCLFNWWCIKLHGTCSRVTMLTLREIRCSHLATRVRSSWPLQYYTHVLWPFVRDYHDKPVPER